MTVAIAVRRRRLGYSVLAGMGVLVATAPFFVLTSGYRLDIFRLALYIAILAATWSLLAGVAGQFSFAHVALAGLGAYASAIWVRDVSGALGTVYVGVLVGTTFSFLVGSLLGLLLLRLRAAYLALFTIAFAEIARLIVVAERDFTGGRLSLAVRQLPGNELAHHYLILGLLVATLGSIYWLMTSKTGLFLRAMREDAEAAAAMGVNVVRLKLFVFSVTSAMIGFAATVYTHTTSRIAPERIDLLLMGEVIAVAVIGGIESPLAAAIGALAMFTILENLRQFSLSPPAVDALTVLVSLLTAALLWLVVRTVRRSPAEFSAGITRLVPWAGAATAGSTLGLYAGGWWRWLLLAVGLAALARLVTGGYALSQTPDQERVVVMLAGAAVALAVLVRLVPVAEVSVDLGVWRFAVFGLVLMLTLRFARNGLVFPLLEYFAGRREARELTVAARAEQASGSEEEALP